MNRKLSYPTLLFVSLLYVLGTSTCEGTDLRAACLDGGGYDYEVTVCQCNTLGYINKCGHGTDVIITDIHFGILNVEKHCLSGACSTQIDCEYKMSVHCDDKQFLEILEKCIGRQGCTVHNSVSRNMLCNGMTVTADYTTVQYRCASNTDLPRFDVCGEGQTPSTVGKQAHLTSPSFPNPDFTKKNRLCCCNLTGIEDFYLLHYSSRNTTGPHIQFGEFTMSGLQTVDFKNKLANVHINPNAHGTYFLTWKQDGTTINSGVFLASLIGHGSTNVAVSCGTTDCPQLLLPPTRQTTPRHDVTHGGPTVEQDSDDKPSVVLYAGIAGGVVTLIIATVVTVLLVRKRMSKKENKEYTTPGPAVSLDTPITYSGLNPSDNNTIYEEIVDPAYIPMGNAPTEATQSTPTPAQDTYQIENRAVVYQNSDFSDYQNA